MSAYWVYRCYDSSGRLIYVGCTKNLFGRIATHRSKSWWAPQVARVAAKVYPSRAIAGPIERRAIATENPRWNIVGRWAVNAMWGRQDFEDFIRAIEERPPTSDNARDIERARRLLWSRFGMQAAA